METSVRGAPLRLRGLVNRVCLPSQAGLVGSEVDRLDQPRVGRYLVPFVQHQHITRDKLLGVEASLLAVAEHRRERGQQPFQRRHRAFGPVLL